MRRIFNILLVATAILAASCTTGKESPKIDITGTWDLINIEVTKAAQLGEESISVEITFKSDNTFSIRQTLGEGREEKFDGTWQLSGDTLNGKYSNGKAWGSSYTVSIENNTLTMIPESGAEVYSYRKK